MKIAFFSRNMSFCDQILEELRQHHTLKIWRNNPNERIAWSSVMKLLDWCDIGYLEWLQPPNLEISQIQEVGKPLVAFCHGVDVMNHSLVDWRNISGLIIQDALAPRLQILRDAWHKVYPDRPPLPRLPKKQLIQSLGVDLEMFTPIPPLSVIPEYHIVTHATFIRPTKRIYTAIQQFYDLLCMDPDKPWKLTIIGQWEGGWKEGERREYLIALRELINELNFPENRLFIRYSNLPRDQWAGFLKTADVYWCTSWRESFGASMAEACATGVHPFVNQFLGASRIYPPEHLCKTPGIMVKKTIEWGNLTEEAKRLKRQAIRKHIEKFNAKQAAANIRTFLESIAEGYSKKLRVGRTRA